MRKISIAGALAVCMIAAPAAASIFVIGSDAGKQCYDAARNGSGSLDALQVCDQALAGGNLQRDERVATYVNRGIVKIHSGRYDAAIQDFDRAIAMDPSEPESYLNKGSALLRSEASPAEAKALFSEALQRDTRRPELAFFGRAIASELTGDLKSAYLDYKRAQEAAPRWRQPRRELSRFQVKRASSSM
jgi:tetratricopeptide (TPR) repeat protein